MTKLIVTDACEIETEIKQTKQTLEKARFHIETEIEQAKQTYEKVRFHKDQLNNEDWLNISCAIALRIDVLQQRLEKSVDK